jgi:murein DD-endopeptidase MepM/ murein hydrolase activator NlpD
MGLSRRGRLRTLSESVAPAPESPERRARGINGILRRGLVARRPSYTPPHPLAINLSPAVRRLWTASLLALLALIATGIAPAAAQSMIAVVTDPDGVNLRGGPGTEFMSLAVIPKGTELPVLGPKVNINWIPVSYQNRLGFVIDQYVELRTVQPTLATLPTQPQPLLSPTPLASPGASPSPSPSASPGQFMRAISPDGVNLRAGASMDQRVLAVIPYGARVTVLGRSADGRWVNVIYNNQAGWVDAQYLGPWDDRQNVPPQDTPGAAAGTSRFIWPVSARSITTGYSGAHPGIDIDQYPAGGNQVVATAAGRVTFAGGNPCCSYGLYVVLEHHDGAESLYAHLQSVEVREGQEVAQGQLLGRSGNTGRSTGAHLHFEIHLGGVTVDPMGMLPR